MIRNVRISALTLLVLLTLTGCAQATPTTMPTAVSMPTTATAIRVAPTRTLTQIPTLTLTPTPLPTHTLTATVYPTASLSLHGLYFGQKPPGMVAEIFAPGVVSDPDFSEYSGTFSPDGREYYFYRFSGSTKAILLTSKMVDDTWTPPEPVEFSQGYAAFEPYIGFDNTRLYFNWDHVTPSGKVVFPAYFFVERVAGGWSEPIFAGQGMFLSSSRDGQFYTTDMSSRNVDGKTYLARITMDNGIFTSFERLSIQPRYGYQAHPCIAPDGSYILFDVNSGNYLFASFKGADGSWGEAIDLTEHGFDPQAGGAYISPDGKYLFFSLHGDIWWVDIAVIENLRPGE